MCGVWCVVVAALSAGQEMHFCPLCSNLLLIEDGLTGMRFCCPTCPYVHDITKTYSSQVKLTRKEVDDVLGGEDAWENVDRTETSCPHCGHNTAYFMQMQIRSVSCALLLSFFLFSNLHYYI